MSQVRFEPAWLRNLRITKVALVGNGANPLAEIAIFKRDAQDEAGEIKPVEQSQSSTSQPPPRHTRAVADYDTDLDRLAKRMQQADEDFSLAYERGIMTDEGRLLYAGREEARRLELERSDKRQGPWHKSLGTDVKLDELTAAQEFDVLVEKTSNERGLREKDARDQVLSTPHGARLMSVIQREQGDYESASSWDFVAKALISRKQSVDE